MTRALRTLVPVLLVFAALYLAASYLISQLLDIPLWDALTLNLPDEWWIE